ncbi:putative pentatricopeptide repeat protein [Heracleum sosnowskyi]|uniref:Pentatricopeptide repeat protein n=1 Tax=Heracleum sosnowskyi TaxID=360622 RepID=A0AAD8JH18_9APIA|nr:putative pentatricopeptide repeat protein [Heracleum sosnowskyi]
MAKNIFDSLPSKDLSPDVKTYTMMIQGFCQEGLLDEASELFVEMEANDCMPNDVTYNTLIRGCFHNEKYNEASVLIDQMRARSFSEDASTTSVLLDLLVSKEHDPAIIALRKKYLT